MPELGIPSIIEKRSIGAECCVMWRWMRRLIRLPDWTEVLSRLTDTFIGVRVWTPEDWRGLLRRKLLDRPISFYSRY